MRGLDDLPLFACGFRPMFLAGAAFAALAVPAWILLHAGGATAWHALPAQLWHGHEMLFGFGLAAAAGFLLTAVPNWTSTPFRAGLPLAATSLAWVGARLLLAPGLPLGWPAAAALQLAFLPAVIAMIAPPLLRTANRNRVLLLPLAALWACDAVFLWAAARADVRLASLVLAVTVDLLLVLVTVIGGRIIPAFTANALRMRGEAPGTRTTAWLERALPGAMGLLAFADALAPTATINGALAGLLALAHAWRLSGWEGWRTRGQPILWSLHLAYAWLPLGLALKSAWLLGGLEVGRYWLHALGAGTIATMVFAVITRVALGHSGRPLVVRPSIAAAYVLLHLGALLRVVGPAMFPEDYERVLAAAAIAWTLAFLCFLVVYAPILVSRRPDGKPG
ncbi:MAG: NnrS family protein [Steroidobacteraceae bacterium]